MSPRARLLSGSKSDVQGRTTRRNSYARFDDANSTRNTRPDYGGGGMSVEAINWALRQVTDEPVDKLILICLANYAGDDHSSFPSRKKLAEVGMCSVDTVDRANKRLEARGLISKSERLHARGGKASNCYTLNVDEVAARCGHVQPPAVVAARVPPPQPHDAPRVAASGRGQGSRTRCGYKEPSKEPSKEISPQPPKGGHRLWML